MTRRIPPLPTPTSSPAPGVSGRTRRLAALFLLLLLAGWAPACLRAQPDPAPAAEAPGATEEARRLVLCLDGTWNHTYQVKRRDDGSEVVKPSNVLKLARSVRAAGGGRPQIVYYDIGVGSLAAYPGVSNHLLSKADSWLGGGFGAGFEANVEDALTFLAFNHRPGDEVFLFGFSRGAATARAVAQFLSWSEGLPARGDEYYLPEIFRAYIDSKGRTSRASVLAGINAGKAPERQVRSAFRPVVVRYLGVWDTVMALGSRLKSRDEATTARSERAFLLKRTVPTAVVHARQALAIDEVRYDFRPEVWLRAGEGQTLKQAWFPGVHSNVGGGYPDDGVANCAFRWILEGAVEAGLERTDFAKPYGCFAQDRLYRSDRTLYRVLDALRRRSGRGRRELTGWGEAAGLTLHRSVIHRLQADPAKFPTLRGRPYRPENVLRFLAAQPDLDAYLASVEGLRPELRFLPPDVLARIEELRAQR